MATLPQTPDLPGPPAYQVGPSMRTALKAALVHAAGRGWLPWAPCLSAIPTLQVEALMSLGMVAFTSHRKSVRRSGKGWVALCPCHDDTDPSLSLQQKNGTVLFRCHAGCDQGDLVAFFRKVGVLSSGQDAGSLPEYYRDQLIVERYLYTDGSGKARFYVCRTAGKEFPVHSPEGKWGMDGARPVLYNLPAVSEV